MDNLDESENNAKISDSAYSNSCSNSQSRRSNSSKSTHSGSHSSGSSGYGGKPSAYGDKSQVVQPEKRAKDGKKNKKTTQTEKTVEVPVPTEEKPPDVEPPPETAIEEITDNVATLPTEQMQLEKVSDNMDIVTVRGSDKEEDDFCPTMMLTPNCIETRSTCSNSADGFSCVISMHDGVVMYTTSSLTTTLGYPKDLWIGRSFIDFVHPRDRNTFASHITTGLAVPKNVNGTVEEVPQAQISVCTMVCRIRRYRNLTTGFGVKERRLTFMPFLLKLSFKNISDEEGKITYLVIQASPFFSAFKTPNEVVFKAVPFVIRHTANGILEYIDPASVPYLGYLPQDLVDKNALLLYHVEDLPYLRQVYETIVKEGGVSKSKDYRMIAQNGDSIRVETEWSSFINPWSRKLEFVIGKHHILEGPFNPDVFQSPPPEKPTKVNEEENNRAHALRESIIRIMNEVLTKPAEMAKHQMSKRCQDLASFMESLMEEEPRPEDELRLEIKDADNSYYERDSVMLGGISPHHEYNDSKSSTETPLSYTQLNYNDTLTRYFDSHQPYSYEDCNTVTGENILDIKTFESDSGHCIYSVAENFGGSGKMSPCGSGHVTGKNSPPALMGDYSPMKLTESLLMKHNADMEKELMKIHRDTRLASKEDREKSSETRQKKKEHLARCNAAYQPTLAANAQIAQPHGVKRGSKQQDSEVGMHKHHCPAPRQSRRRQSTPAVHAQSTAPVVTTAGNQWPGHSVNGMNTFILGVGIPQQMSIMTPSPMLCQPMPGPPHTQGLYLSGMIPMYYAPATTPNMTSTSDINAMPGNSNSHYHQSGILNQMQCMMYGQPVYGSPLMYSPMNHQLPYPPQPGLAAQHTEVQTNLAALPLGLTSSNYEEACIPSSSLRSKAPSNLSAKWQEKLKNQEMNKMDRGSGNSTTSSSALKRSTEAVQYTMTSRDSKMKNTEETVDRTDGESSYSSFYSSFFKTESGSADDSGDARKSQQSRNAINASNMYYESPHTKKVARRKMDPPWMEQVCVTSELVYKYKVSTKSVEEVLEADKLKMMSVEQPSLVNEQLGQLYLDLQLEGVAARLTLEEGITSSSSSGEETLVSSKDSKTRRKRHYSKLVMIYEEDAPLPPSPEEFAAPASPAADTPD